MPAPLVPRLTRLFTVDASAPYVFQFDACLSIADENSAEVTKHPVEAGANVADHVIVQPRSIRLDVVFSNTPLADAALSTGGVAIDNPKRAETLYQALVSLQRAARVFGIVHELLEPKVSDLSFFDTGLFVITSITTTRDVANGGIVEPTIVLQELRFVTNASSSLPRTIQTTGAAKKVDGKKDKEVATAAEEAKAQAKTLLLQAQEAVTR